MRRQRQGGGGAGGFGDRCKQQDVPVPGCAGVGLDGDIVGVEGGSQGRGADAVG